MSMDTLEKEITKLIAEIIETDDEEVWENRDKHLFEDLGLDSLLGLEIIASIEKKYRIEIEEDRLQEITTLNKTIKLVKDVLASSNLEAK